MNGFGNDDPRDMPAHLFYRSLRVNHETAVRADTDKQNCSICPRYWYADAIFPCDRCGAEFTFTASIPYRGIAWRAGGTSGISRRCARSMTEM